MEAKNTDIVQKSKGLVKSCFYHNSSIPPLKNTPIYKNYLSFKQNTPYFCRVIIHFFNK
jgi:hypothetical protein